MGQYYNIAMKREGEKIKAFDRTLDGEYQGAKLMEHSWFLNPMVNAIAEKLYYKKAQVAWVGDYADSKEDGDDLELYNAVWGENVKYQPLSKTTFTLSGRYLVNHTKKLVLDCWEYVKNSIKSPTNKDGWVTHPLPLLTAVGNGRGGGDYGGINEDKIGCWAWDVLEIVEQETMNELTKNKGYQEFEILFEE